MILVGSAAGLRIWARTHGRRKQCRWPYEPSTLLIHLCICDQLRSPSSSINNKHMRVTGLFVAIAVASLRASGATPSTTTDSISALPEEKNPAATLPSVRVNEGQNAGDEEKRGRNDKVEERGVFSWITRCFSGGKQVAPPIKFRIGDLNGKKFMPASDRVV
uniref:RxLR effector candidate protein n=1 Tax=Hyaloperonospora arabidopsidis (strain Emoy2) TaxID=559515 RepID=M4BCJ5_HYAAE|nr:RxLR effector candidate protein [Hyaloperonospora arabidopsidis Emoy2]